MFEIVKRLKLALAQAFRPSLLNYASLGNETRHLHLHVIPRYENPIEFAGMTFVDTQWGHNPYPYNKDHHISNATYEKISTSLKSKL